MRRANSTPPDLRGFEHVRWLGGGGFADVFLYRQRRPNREVAIKVLRNSVFDADVQEQFEAEADLMAAVSEHPFIVSIYGADIAPDGRPYLVMEYYSHGHYNDRARAADVPVEEALRVGIQIASAVETAHEAGIIHNDIKPSNILLSGFGRPGLTDFGISVEARQTDGRGARGASLPYTAPEILEQELHGSRASDVFSLGATIYALVAGHSPFERPGGSNDSAKVMERVLREPPPPLRRDGMPGSLEHLLRQALAKDPHQRPQTARALAVALQAIEVDLGLAMTQLALRSSLDTTTADLEADDERTTYRPLVVNPDAQPERSHPQTRIGAAARIEPVERVASEVADDRAEPMFVDADQHALTDVTMARRRDTAMAEEQTVGRVGLARPEPAGAESLDEDGPRLSRRWVALAGALCSLAAIGIVVVLLSGRGEDSRPPSDDDAGVEQAVTGDAPALVIVSAPTDVVGSRVADGVVFTWSPPAGGPVDHYRVRRLDGASGDRAIEQVDEPRYELTNVSPDVAPCIEVETVRDGRLSNASPAVCVP